MLTAVMSVFIRKYTPRPCNDPNHVGVLPFRLIFTVSFRVTVCLGLGIGLGSGLNELGLGEMGLGEMGQNLHVTARQKLLSALLLLLLFWHINILH